MDAGSKNAQIKASLKATRDKHAGMVCRAFKVKVVPSKLAKVKKQKLDTLFREAKWLRNSELAKGDYSLFNRNAKTVTVKVGDRFEEYPLTLLGSQMRQDVVDKLRSEIIGLATKKANGEKVGRLKFKSYCNSIPLRQYGTTYRIDFERNTISVQNMSKYPLKVRGLKQIPSDADIANAKLIRKPSGYYFHITTYCPPKEQKQTGRMEGIDFGIGNNLTLTDGTTFNIRIPESKSIKLASRRVNRSCHKNGKVKGSNHWKRVRKLQVAYEKQTNRKHDLANKCVSSLLRDCDFIAIQDEMIANWHKGLFGKQVQHSAMGFIKSKLKTSSQVHVVRRSFPSTQKCPVCGRNTKHPLNKRDYTCQYCGYRHPSRDAKSAAMILAEATQIVSVERGAKSPVEIATSTDQSVRGMESKPSSAKQEAQVL